MKFVAVISMLLTLTAWGQNNLIGVAVNSPVEGKEVKIELAPPKNYLIKGVEYVLHSEAGKPVSTPATWQRGKIEASNNKSIAVIPVTLSPGHYKAHIRTTSTDKKGERRSVMVPFEVTELKEVPDPGEEGKKTLAGIDSDKDGIRDDIQIWINSKFPISSLPSTNKALKQMAKYEQLALIHHTDKELAKEYKDKNSLALYCLMWVKDLNEVNRMTKELDKILYNTSERIKAFLTTEGYMHGSNKPKEAKALKDEDHSQLCEFEANKE